MQIIREWVYPRNSEMSEARLFELCKKSFYDDIKALLHSLTEDRRRALVKARDTTVRTSWTSNVPALLFTLQTRIEHPSIMRVPER